MRLSLLMLCIYAMIFLLIVARVRIRILSVSGENIMIMRRLCCGCCRLFLCQEPAAPAKDAKEEDPAAEAKDLIEGMGWPAHFSSMICTKPVQHDVSSHRGCLSASRKDLCMAPLFSWPDDELRWIPCFIDTYNHIFWSITIAHTNQNVDQILYHFENTAARFSALRGEEALVACSSEDRLASLMPPDQVFGSSQPRCGTKKCSSFCISETATWKSFEISEVLLRFYWECVTSPPKINKPMIEHVYQFPSQLVAFCGLRL